MLLASLRLGILLVTLVASLHVAAAPRFWTLTGVPNTADRCCFEAATGYFSYDDSTNTISNWNVRVDGFQFVTLPPFIYVPGNSTVNVSPPSGATGPTFSFSAAISVPEEGGWFRISGVRQLQITPLTALDGSTATVSLDTSLSREALPSLVPTRVRQFNGTLTLTPVPPQVVIAQVDEFYHFALRHFFITADDAEKQALDTGVHFGWLRTGYSFKAYARGSSTGKSVHPVCRYYSPAIVEFEDGNEVGSDSHFFSADWDECAVVLRRYGYAYWLLEFDNAFQIALPDKSSGACPVGTIPVYRLWNQRVDSNHRYTTSAAIKAEMLGAGYLAEGYGPDGAVMCAVQ
jgi:hypothetical protein